MTTQGLPSRRGSRPFNTDLPSRRSRVATTSVQDERVAVERERLATKATRRRRRTTTLADIAAKATAPTAGEAGPATGRHDGPHPVTRHLVRRTRRAMGVSRT